MYESHFGLKQRPFRAGPDRDFYYPATGHEKTLNRIVQGLGDDEGIILLTAEPGLGKTLLLHCLPDRLNTAGNCALLTNSHCSDRAALFQSILFELALPYENRGEQELRLVLTNFLLDQFRAGCRTVLMIDEAHHLELDLLEELRLLGNLEGGNGKALQIVMACLPSFQDLVSMPELTAFRQRLAVRTYLDPLTLHEAADFLFHQLRVAGGTPERLISDEALEILARGSGGVPRLLNQAAHQAFSLAFVNGTHGVDAEAALEALAILGVDSEETLPIDQPLCSPMDPDEPCATGTPGRPERIWFEENDQKAAWTGPTIHAEDDMGSGAVTPTTRRPA